MDTESQTLFSNDLQSITKQSVVLFEVLVNRLEHVQKTIDQTEAVVIASSANDQLLTLNPETQLDLLYLVGEKLREAKKEIKQIQETINKRVA
jgi:hypothetical protein